MNRHLRATIGKRTFPAALTTALAVLLIWAAAVQATPPAQNRGYFVQPGDTLSGIALRARVSLEQLMELNGIVDANAIVVGQLLLLPPGSFIQETPTSSGEEDTQPAASTLTDVHVVQPGESLSQIAERYAIDMADLMRLNGIVNPDHVRLGQRLRLTRVVDTEQAREVEPTPAPDDAGDVAPAKRLSTLLNRAYTVEQGDNLAGIAIRFGVDETALRALNGLEDASIFDVEVGQELVLPATNLELQVERIQPVSDRVEHAVAAGDSLGMIAEEYGLTLAELMQANYISNPDAIYIGQTLEIPIQQEENNEPTVTLEQIGRPRTGFYYYTVKTGDTLSELAREFDSTPLAIMEYNDLPDAETVYDGLPLRIPYGPPPLPIDLPPTPLSGTRFLVSLSRQQCWLLEGDHVLHQWTCSTGYGKWITRTGSFEVQTMLEMAGSRAYELDMPYWLGIYDVGSYENGIHGLPIEWETGQKIWEGLVGMPATFGCAMLDDDDAATLYNLAYLGMPVYIVP